MQTTIRSLVVGAALLMALPAHADTVSDADAELALVTELFNEIQPKSFKRNREFCGYIGLDEDGELVASKPKRGRKASCTPRDPRNIEVILASYHTHGGYEGHDGYELPSVEDMESDESEGIDGYVATPGGRLWYIDTEDMTISLVCGPRCLVTAEGYQPEPDADIRDFYSYDELVEVYEEDQ